MCLLVDAYGIARIDMVLSLVAHGSDGIRNMFLRHDPPNSVSKQCTALVYDPTIRVDPSRWWIRGIDGVHGQ
jgi:hypothetical protein